MIQFSLLFGHAMNRGKDVRRGYSNKLIILFIESSLDLNAQKNNPEDLLSKNAISFDQIILIFS